MSISVQPCAFSPLTPALSPLRGEGVAAHALRSGPAPCLVRQVSPPEWTVGGSRRMGPSTLREPSRPLSPQRGGPGCTAVEISREDSSPAPEGRHLCSSETKSTPKLRRSDIGWNIPPLRGLRCCGSGRFYKDSAPTELALIGPHQNHFLISTAVGPG